MSAAMFLTGWALAYPLAVIFVHRWVQRVHFLDAQALRQSGNPQLHETPTRVLNSPFSVGSGERGANQIHEGFCK